MNSKIVFFGTEDFSLITLRTLVEAGYTISAVVTKPDFKRGRGYQLAEPAVKTYAKQHDIPVLQPEKLTTITEDLRQLQPTVGILVSYGKLIPRSILDLFTPGIINVHPSLLPLYRGPSPIEAAIINRDTETGVSIMLLTEAMDAGPVYAQVTLTLNGDETQSSLYQSLGESGAQLLLARLAEILDGSLQPEIQDDSKASYCPLLTKDMSWIDTDKHTADQAEAMIRAYEIFPRTRYQIGGQTLIITAGRVVSQASTDLDITFADGSVLAIDQVIAPSGKKMSAADYLRGHSI